MDRRIRIVAHPHEEVDVEKLAWALLEYLRQQTAAEHADLPKTPPSEVPS